MADPIFESFVDPDDGTVWRVDLGFLRSRWNCIWDRGCAGIGDTVNVEARLGCCSVGAELLDDDEAMTIAALAATLEPASFEQAGAAATGGVLREDRHHTRVVDGACIFLNRPGFDGPLGCALHVAATAAGEPASDWKPSICWQLPLKVEAGADGTRTLRRWQRDDWGPGGADLAWCCTEPADGSGPDAWTGGRPVIDTLGDEIVELVGTEVAVELRRAVYDDGGGGR